MATYNKFLCTVEDVAEKKHNLGADTLTIALTAAANAPVNTNTVLANLTQASYTFCSSRACSTSSSVQTSGTYTLILGNLVLTASGGNVGPFRYCVLYNDTATNDELIAWWDYTSDLTLGTTETFTLTFDGSAGVLTIA